MTEENREEATPDPRYDVDEDGRLVPHEPNEQRFSLDFDED